MPEINNSDTIRSQYLNQDRGVSLDRLVREREQIEQGGLDKVEFRDKPKSMDRDDFLKLLVKQLTTQDPTAPVQDQQFISQMAQFSSLEQMKNMSDGFQSMSNRQAIGLVGKFVVGKDYTSGESASGIAQALIFDSAGQAFLKVGPRAILVKDIEMVADPSTVRPEFGGQASGAPAAAQPGQAPGTQGIPAAPPREDAMQPRPENPAASDASRDRVQAPAARDRVDAPPADAPAARDRADVPAPAERPVHAQPQSFYYGEPGHGSSVRAKTEFAA
jgi:flagellar basal-body rod modification protein FlgD